MTDEVATALIAGTSGFAGGLVVAVSNYALSRAQARDARRDAVGRSMKQFLTVVNRIDHLLRMEPRGAEPPTSRLVSRSAWLDFGLARLHTRLLNPGLDVLVEKINEAMADAVITLPAEVLPSMEAVAALMAEERRDDKWWARWEDARGELVVAFRSTAGHRVAMT